MLEADAAPVASQLLAFLREPVRHRPRYIHGEQAIPAGQWVFKFAQGRVPHTLLRDLSAEERGELREAASAFIRQVCLREGATHYQVLCLPPHARREAVKENYHLLMALIHPDRQEAQHAAWPTGCAQRVNHAYAVLSDDVRRAAYDVGLDKVDSGNTRRADIPPAAAETVARRPQGRPRQGEAVARMGRPLALVTGAAAAIVLFQMWLVSDLPTEYATLERAFPFDVSLRWMREAIGGTELPRLLVAEAPSQDKTARDDDGSFLASLWRSRTAPDPPVPASQPSRSSPARETDAHPSAMAPAPLAPSSEPPSAKLGMDLTKELKTPVLVKPDAGAPTSSISPPAPREKRITTSDIEATVARLIGYYEAGDLDQLMALVDSSGSSYWKTEQMKQLFHEFFRATKQRHLRLSRLAWQVQADSAQARGQAALSAQYFDEPGTVERKVDLELNIELRDGRPRITQLTLFPNGP